MKKQYIRTGLNKKSYALIPRDVLYDYLSKDVVFMVELFVKIYPLVLDDGNLNNLYHNLLIPASNNLSIIELNGFPISQTEVNKSKVELEDLIAEPLNNMIEITGLKTFNPKSNLQVIAALTDGIIKSKSNTKNEKTLHGQNLPIRKSGAEVLEPYKENEFVKNLLKYREYQKLYSTYIKPYDINSDKHLPNLEKGRINPTFLLHGTVTGRLSCTDPNIQNIPKVDYIRRFMKPLSGRIFVSLDYSQAELRSLAVLSEDENLINIFNSGKDLHTAVAEEMFGEEYTKLNDDIDEEHLKKTKLRRYAKTVNFGVIYGVMAPTLSKRLKITEDEAQTYIDNWFDRFKDAKIFMDETREDHLNALVTKFGRNRRFHILTNKNKISIENERGNFLHQSMCSDFALESSIRINYNTNHSWINNLSHEDKEILVKIFSNSLSDYSITTETLIEKLCGKTLIKCLYGNPIQVNIIHDDNMFEIDDKDKHIKSLIQVVKIVMEQVPRDLGITKVTFNADPSIGYDWSKMKDINIDELKN
jgi:DNA polymerase-1